MEDISRCDLAVEAHETVAKEKAEGLIGVTLTESEDLSNIKVTRIKVENEDGAKAVRKPIGNYITLEVSQNVSDFNEVFDDICIICANEIKKLTDLFLKNNDETVLVIGLGNYRITADSLGPKVVEGVMMTRHLKRFKEFEKFLSICALAPGVLGTTGMETEEIVKSLVNEINPKIVIAIDALCSRSVNRVNRTIQITDTGITPGGGVGNKRRSINKSSLGVPVIAIGVPTVIDAATIAAAGIDAVSGEVDDSGNFSDNGERIEWLRGELGDELKNMIVTPKEVDAAIDDIAKIIAKSINDSLHSAQKSEAD